MSAPPRRRGRRGGADVHGLLLVDKPSGPTSFDIVREVRRATRTRKVGHAGTLDPLADGLLLVCLGEGTKLVPWLMDAEKEYVATLRLGVETDTLDAQGAVTARADVPPLDDARVEEVLARFRGPIRQVPPAYSALKRDGERLYEKARRGEEVAVEAREVVVHGLALEGRSAAELVLRVRCGKGFYVRSLARDVGAALGCGAHLTALRRTATAGFRVEDAHAPATLAAEDAWRGALVPLDEALGHLPAVALDETGAQRIWHGNPTRWADAAPPPDGPLRLRAPDGTLLAIGEARSDDDGAALHVLRGFRTGWTPPPAAAGPASEGAAG